MVKRMFLYQKICILVQEIKILPKVGMMVLCIPAGAYYILYKRNSEWSP